MASRDDSDRYLDIIRFLFITFLIFKVSLKFKLHLEDVIVYIQTQIHTFMKGNGVYIYFQVIIFKNNFLNFKSNNSAIINPGKCI